MPLHSSGLGFYQTFFSSNLRLKLQGMCQIRAFTKNTRIQNIVFENISLTQRKTYICISCNSPGYIKYNLVLSFGIICGPQHRVVSKKNNSIAYLLEAHFNKKVVFFYNCPCKHVTQCQLVKPPSHLDRF